MIKITARGRMDERESAFPQAVELASGEILCSLSVGGGPEAEGGTELYRSSDSGNTWMYSGSILPPDDVSRTTNCLRISMSSDGKRLFAYGVRFYKKRGGKFGERKNEPVLCVSEDCGSIWSQPHILPMPCSGPFEISHSILSMRNGRLLAPAATLLSKKRLGEKVIAAVSEDSGLTWNRHTTVFRDPKRELGFFEHKLAEYAPGKLIAVCWTVTLGGVEDRPNSYALSEDGGLSWSPHMSTGIYGQTMTPVPLGEERLLVLYNKRYGRQGIIAALVSFNSHGWKVLEEKVLYDTGVKREKPSGIVTGVQEFDGFMFGFPTAIRLGDGTFLATYWSKENGKFGVSWAKLLAEC